MFPHRRFLEQSFSYRGMLRMWYREKLYRFGYYQKAVIHESNHNHEHQQNSPTLPEAGHAAESVSTE